MKNLIYFEANTTIEQIFTDNHKRARSKSIFYSLKRMIQNKKETEEFNLMAFKKSEKRIRFWSNILVYLVVVLVYLERVFDLFMDEYRLVEGASEESENFDWRLDITSLAL